MRATGRETPDRRLIRRSRGAAFYAWPALILALVACAPQRGTIGAMLGQKSDGRVFVREVPPGLAADKAGLEEGDEILLVDGLDVRTMNDRRLHSALSGEVGDKVKLTVARGTEILRVTLTRTAAQRLKKDPRREAR
jgi:C-terminal processing protease CtpA/Prc